MIHNILNNIVQQKSESHSLWKKEVKLSLQHAMKAQMASKFGTRSGVHDN